MVKHQRRSHQRGFHPSELDDSMSETGSEDSPATPKSHSMHWQPQNVSMMGHHGHHLHRTTSFADFSQHMNSYSMQQQHQYGHRHTPPSGGAHEYHGHPHPHPQTIYEQRRQQQQPPPPQQQHPEVHMLQRTASLPQHSYFVTEQNNPGVATMDTNSHPQPPPIHSQYQQMPRQNVERLPLEIPYTSAPALTSSIQSSPSSFSGASGRSPSTQDSFYTHAPTTQAATYALHTASPIEQQAPQMVGYQGQMAQQPQVMAQPPQQHQQQPAQPRQSAPLAQPTQEQYQAPHTQAEESAWYHAVAYHPPVEVEVVSVNQINTYGSSVFDPWGGPKIEYEDPSMQLPSARIENM